MTVTRRIAGHLLRGRRCGAANQRSNYECCRIVHSARSYHFVIVVWRAKEGDSRTMKTNILSLILASLLIGFAFLQAAQAVNPPPDGGYPGGNTAEGVNALLKLDSAIGINNTAVGA